MVIMLKEAYLLHGKFYKVFMMEHRFQNTAQRFRFFLSLLQVNLPTA